MIPPCPGTSRPRVCTDSVRSARSVAGWLPTVHRYRVTARTGAANVRSCRCRLAPRPCCLTLPALDLLLGRDTRNPDERDVEALTERKAFRYITWAWVPLQVALLVFALLHARHGLPLEEWLGTAASA